MMQAGPLHRMTRGVDADESGDIGELADRGAPDHAVALNVGVVAELKFADPATLGDGIENLQIEDGRGRLECAFFTTCRRTTSPPCCPMWAGGNMWTSLLRW